MAVGKLITDEDADMRVSLGHISALGSGLYSVGPGRIWCINGNNGNDGNEGHEWDEPKKTIQPVLTQIRADRNAGVIPDNIWDWVLIAPGDYEEKLVVPACHLIGLGTWGNDRGVRIIVNDDNAEPGIQGAVTAVTGISGLHMENIRVQSKGAVAVELFHMGVLNASWIVNCSFRGADGSPDTVTYGIYIENSLGVHILNCDFYAINKGIYLGPGGADKFFNNGEIARSKFRTQAEAITVTDNMVTSGSVIHNNIICVNTAVAGIDLGNCGMLVVNNYVTTPGGTPIIHDGAARLEIGNHTNDGTTVVDPSPAAGAL